MGSAQRFRQADVARQNGELARLKIVEGPDYGAIFVINGPRATIGRGEENDIVISDLKASRQHAEVLLSGGVWMLKDLGSANGIGLNGKVIRATPLKPMEVFTLGETTVEFVSSDAATTVVVAPPKSIFDIRNGQAALEEQKKKIRGIGGAPGAPRPQAASQKKGGALLILGALIGVYLLLDSDDQPSRKPTRENREGDANREITSIAPPSIPSTATQKTADTLFRLGFREYREKHYLRAKTFFETVLQMAPDHQLAKRYAENANLRIKEEVKSNLEGGKKSMDAGKLKEARGHYEAVLRLLWREQSTPEYAEAKDQLQKVIKEMEEGTN